MGGGTDNLMDDDEFPCPEEQKEEVKEE